MKFMVPVAGRLVRIHPAPELRLLQAVRLRRLCQPCLPESFGRDKRRPDAPNVTQIHLFRRLWGSALLWTRFRPMSRPATPPFFGAATQSRSGL